MFFNKTHKMLQDLKSQLKTTFNTINKQSERTQFANNKLTDIESTIDEINNNLNNLYNLVINVACIDQLNILNFYFDIYEKNISTIKDDKKLIESVTNTINNYADQLHNNTYLDDKNIIEGYQKRIADIISMINGEQETKTDNKVKIGRKAITQETIDQIINLYETSVNSHTEIARIVGVSRSTVDKYIKKYENRD